MWRENLVLSYEWIALNTEYCRIIGLEFCVNFIIVWHHKSHLRSIQYSWMMSGQIERVCELRMCVVFVLMSCVVCAVFISLWLFFFSIFDASDIVIKAIFALSILHFYKYDFFLRFTVECWMCNVTLKFLWHFLPLRWK